MVPLRIALVFPRKLNELLLVLNLDSDEFIIHVINLLLMLAQVQANQLRNVIQ